MSLEQMIVVAYMTALLISHVAKIGTIGEDAKRDGKSGTFLVAVLLVTSFHLVAIWALFSGGFFE